MARPTAQQMSFADLELLRQGVRLEPLLQAICDLLDQQPALIESGFGTTWCAASNGRLRAAAASPRRRCCAHWF
jgi:hypothetical protein